MRSKNEPDAGRVVAIAVSPAGERYRIVTAMTGVPLRTGPGGGLLPIVLEVLGEAFIGARSPARKVAVFGCTDRGFERRFLKLHMDSPSAAEQVVADIMSEIERGQARWKRPS